MKLLIVDGCISQRGADSRTRKLLTAYVEAFRGAHPEAEAETVTPEALLALKPFDPAMLDERDALAAGGTGEATELVRAPKLRGVDALVAAAPFRGGKFLRTGRQGWNVFRHVHLHIS